MPSEQPDYRRYLVPIDTASTQQLFTDCLIIGAGIAGLRAAIEAAAGCSVTLLCKGSFSDSNTWNAQGGIASVMGVDDSLQSHIDDTIKTGLTRLTGKSTLLSKEATATPVSHTLTATLPAEVSLKRCWGL